MAKKPNAFTRASFIFLSTVFFLSGFCSLVYQMIWTRMLSLVFGHTLFAVSTVITAFMGGLALGSYYFGRFADRESAVKSFFKRQGGSSLFLLYGVMEAAIGLYCLFTPFLFRLAEGVYLSFAGTSYGVLSAIRFVLCALILLLPTFLMGGTLPLLSKFYIRESDEMGQKLGFLYFINTMGAALGAFIAGFGLIRIIGIQQSLAAAAALNMAIGLSVYLFNRNTVRIAESPLEGRDEGESAGENHEKRTVSGLRLLVMVFALTGFASMIYEICWMRALALALGSSVYAFSTMLTTFLFGIAAGSILFSLLSRKWSFGLSSFGWLEIVTGLFCLLSVVLLGRMPVYFVSVFPYVKRSYSLIILADFLLSFLAMLLPTLLMGFVFPLVGRLYTATVGHLGKRLGEIYAVNTIGCILGALVTGFFLVPFLGVQMSLKIAIMINIAGGLAVLLLSYRNLLKRVSCILAAVPLSLLIWYMPAWNPMVMSSGAAVYADWFSDGSPFPETRTSSMVFHKDGITSTVTVFKEGKNVYLKVNGKTDASTVSDMPTQLLLGYVPLFYHPAPQEVFIIGLGSGITAKAVLDFPQVRSATCAELEPAVIEANRFFFPFNGNVLNNPRFRVVVDDGRNALLAAPQKYDIVISEPSNPWIAGIGNLFTREFYQTSRSRLKEGGIFCQWFQLYGIQPDDVKMILNTFFSVFPHGLIWRGCDADLILLGSEQPLKFDYGRYLGHLKDNPRLRKALRDINILEPDALFAHYLLDAPELKNLLRTARTNTDNQPLLEFSAPKSLYTDTGTENVGGLYKLKTKRIPDLAQTPAPRLSPFYYAALYRDTEEVFSEKTLKEALRLYPQHAETRLLKVQYLLRHGQVLQAQSELKAMTAEGVRDFRVYLELGRLYVRQGLKKESEAFYEKAYGLDPGNEEIVREYLEILIEGKSYQKAWPIIALAVQQFPGQIEFQTTKGAVLIGLKRYDEALTLLTDVLKNYPDEVAALKNLFTLHKERGDPEAMIRTGEKLLKHNLVEAEFMVVLGRAYFAKGDYARGKATLKQGLKINPYNREIAELLAAMESKGGVRQ